ncbi:MAG: succinylglutamate desuccinylase [Calditrichaeota bacterium]|nr:succinylglutamate desuccinylase/aspartoacylase family protein [Calditrichota bacterium]RQW06614.1 MAG: succinylglutamate desuccinylase [Calditrichota bacterium]
MKILNFIKANIFAVSMLILALILSVLVTIDFNRLHRDDTFYPSQALSEIRFLHEYHKSLEGTSGDTKIYRFSGEEEGGKVLILGGTHPNEPAAYITTYLILENLGISRGTVYIIPQANASAFTHNDPQEGYPQFFEIQGEKGNRKFRYGSRITNPIDQWPDPDIYLHYPSGQKLAGNETRNLNRAYPGRPDGNLTEQIAYAIVQLIRQEEIDIAFDLHEAAPEYPVVNAIVSTTRSQDVVTEAALELAFEDLHYSLEPSPYNFRGLSHREWDDFTEAFPILMETANPIQGRLRGKTDARLIMTGWDKMYLLGSTLGVLSVPYDSTGLPMEERVGRHLEAFQKILEVYSRSSPQNAIFISGLPSYQELMEEGVEKYF